MTKYKNKKGILLCCNPNIDCDFRTYGDNICKSYGGPNNCGACLDACC